MRTRTKVITSIIALVLSAVMLFVAVAVNNNTGKIVIADTPTRTVALAQSSIDAQSILDEFDDATLTTEGTTTYFEGFKPLDLNAVSELDYISDIDYETLSECIVKYNFSYDYESNIVTIAAAATLPDGSIEIDEITGVGFINDENEIDAVMNIDGEGILLSEMRDAGMIENCGWFSNLIKTVAKAVVVVAVAAVAVAAVVVTAGAAAPAVVAAGVGVSTTVVAGAVATAATIGTYAAITAVIAAGVALTVEIAERYYPGCGAFEDYEDGVKVLYAAWNVATINMIKEILDKNLQNNSEEIYFACYGMKCNPINVRIKPINFNSMRLKMQLGGFSSLTAYSSDAYSVMKAAFPLCDVSETDDYHAKSSTFVRHYHARNIIDNVVDLSHFSVFNKVKQQYFTPHSYFLYS